MGPPLRSAGATPTSRVGSGAPAAGPRSWSLLVMALLSIPMAAYAVIPEGDLRQLVYTLAGTLSVSVALWGLLRIGEARPPGWLLMVGGFLAWVVGDWIYLIEQSVFGVTAYPALSDVVYIGSYGVMAAGLVVVVRRRGSRGDLPALLDAAILATGTAVVVGVFVIAPIIDDSSLSFLGKLTSSLYPLADVLLLGILARLWTTPGGRTSAFKLLAGSLALTLFGDALYNFTMLQGGDVTFLVGLVNDSAWLGGYVLIAGAAWSPSVREVVGPLPGREDVSDPSKRMAVLTGGLLLPAVALLGDTLDGGGVSGMLIATGSIVMSILVLARMAGLLSVVRAQAVQLAALARSDALTGVPNRRTLDYELSRACQTARDQETPLTLAILDLDRFKQYNDTFGHPAGDLFLREATAAWVDLLHEGEILARYGGEEFVVLFPGQTADQARDRVLALLEATPGGQTFSAGVETWDPETDPSTVLFGADIALYNAKSQGRNRVCIAIAADGQADVVRPAIFLQPIVDLRTSEPVAVEALSRFPNSDPSAMFAAARLDGTWAGLEARAITAALEVRPSDLALSVNVSLDGLATSPVRGALDGDLTGVILEITEHAQAPPMSRFADDLRTFRDRGAIIAIDDWGQGYSNLDRLLLLRPEIVKIDISLVHNLDHDYHRAAIQTLCGWADLVGARICAEGVETEAQWRELQSLGVHLGQGWFFGRPVPPGLDDQSRAGVRLDPEHVSV
jgi:diguanylate cyclase (GGDEF)-like protein